MAREHPQAGGVPPPQKKNNKKNPRWIKSPLGPNLPFSHPVAHVGVGPSLVRAPPPPFRSEAAREGAALLGSGREGLAQRGAVTRPGGGSPGSCFWRTGPLPEQS